MQNSNLDFYRKVEQPPEWAIKPIQAGRLKGKSDINPQWRIEALTEQYGPCGIGWYTETKQRWTVPLDDGQLMCFVEVWLYVLVGTVPNEEWSKPIDGTGGNFLIESETRGLHASDEGYKMAETDALSVCCKKLGLGAKVYAGQMDGSKYSRERPDNNEAGTYAQGTSNSVGGSASDNMRVTWGKGGDGKKQSPWYGMTFEDIWNAGNEGHSYLHWVANVSTLNPTAKKAARSVIDRMKARDAGETTEAFATVNEIAAARLVWEKAGLSLDKWGEYVREQEAKHGKVPKAWLDGMLERLYEKHGGKLGAAPAGDDEPLPDEAGDGSDIPF
jgi:hypothetical protein